MQASNISPTLQLSDIVRLNEFGYYELIEKPSQDELSAYYAKKYYQQELRMHESSYSDEELEFRTNRLDQKLRVIRSLATYPLPSAPTFLDIGAGEGFAMAFFHNRGWKVTGLDYSAHGCLIHNPQIMNRLIIGDIKASVDAFAAKGCHFDVILLDPARLLHTLSSLLAKNGLLVIEVPNDFSIFQLHLLERKKIDRAFWVATPDHISYFNRDGLSRLLLSCGFRELSVLADFPIDLFLFNDHTNYVLNRSVGKSCHSVRVQVENLLHKLSPDAVIRMYQAMAELGIGRQLTGYYQLQAT